MKKISIAFVFLTFTSLPAIADVNVDVGDIVCIDRFGSFNIVGEVIDVDHRSNKVRVLESDGDRNWHRASFKDPQR